MRVRIYTPKRLNKDQNVHRFAERERQQQIINKIEIDTHLFVKGNKQIKLGRFRQRALQKALRAESMVDEKSITKKHYGKPTEFIEIC